MKGFTKAVGRLPHQIASVAGYAESHADEDFDKLNDKLNAFYSQLKRLFDDAKIFKDSLIMILDHQTGFFETLVVLLSSNPELSSMEVADKANKLGNIAADIELNLKNVQNELRPELDVIESRVIIPCHEVILLVENARKLVVKRNHKKVDFDRHSESQKKLATSDRNVNDEKKLGQVESSLDIATRDFNSLNATLKQQIPVLLAIKSTLIDPWFLTLYYYQVKVQLRLYQVFYQIVEANFDLHLTAIQVHESKMNECARLLNEITITRRRASVVVAEVDPNLPPLALGAKPPQSSSYGTSNYQHSTQIPKVAPYIANTNSLTDMKTASFAQMHIDATPSTPPTRLPSRTSQSGTYVVALYDFASETEGDLSFCRNDRILVTIRTPSANDWYC